MVAFGEMVNVQHQVGVLQGTFDTLSKIKDDDDDPKTQEEKEEQAEESVDETSNVEDDA